MTDEQLSEKISKSATKLVSRKYPFIMGGDYSGIFTPDYTYRGNYKESEVDKKTGIRTILWVNPDIFFDLYDTDSFLYNTIMNGRMNFTSRYLSSLYQTNDPSYAELEKVDNNIIKDFYETGNLLNTNFQLGYLDFFIRFGFMGNSIGDWSGFLNTDIAIPPTDLK